MSRNAYVSSSSYTLFDLISPETILQNKQSIICVFVLILFRFYFDILTSILGRNLFIVGEYYVYMETHDVVNFLLKKGFQVTPEAAEYLKGTRRLEFQDLVKRIVRDKNRNNDGNFMVAMEDVRNNTIQQNVQDEGDLDDYEIIDGNETIQQQMQGVEG